MSKKELSNLINTALPSTPTCGICTEPFSSSHPPVALRCMHILGHTCIKKWLLSRRQNSNTCPFCRSPVFQSGDAGNARNGNSPAQNGGAVGVNGVGDSDAELWVALCKLAADEQEHEAETELVHAFMCKLWERICEMCQRHRGLRLQLEQQQIQGQNSSRPSSSCSSSASSHSSSLSSSPPPQHKRENENKDTKTSSSFTAAEYLLNAIFPALLHTATSPSLSSTSLSSTTRRQHRRKRLLFLETHNLLHATFASLNRPTTFTRGLTTSLVRLARLMSESSSVMPRWLTSVPRVNMLFWNANACLGGPGPQQIEQVSWTQIDEAARLKEDRYFPLLHLYTVMMSQTLVHLPIRRDQETTALVLQRCCGKIGGAWMGQPSDALKGLCVRVYEELRRFQVEERALSLRAKEGEGDVVKGLWGVAGWITR